MRSRAAAVAAQEHSEEEETDEEDSELQSRRQKGRSRRVTTVGDEIDSKLSIEEFHQKLTWERWSGNGHLVSPESGNSL